MKLSTHLRIALVSFFSSSALAAAVVGDDGTTEGESFSPHVLKPLLNSPSSTQSQARGSAIRGLLQIRQSSCPAGWGACATGGGCCPIGGQCCSNNKCCEAGNHCCSGGGCCEIGDNCVQIISTGERGCCPIGKTCTSNSNPCVTASYSPCANDDFCCPPGDICYRDSANNRLCRPPGAPTSISVPPFSAPSLTVPTFTPPTLSIPTASVSVGTGVLPTVYPTPFAPSGSQNVFVYATDTRITWVGTSWTVGASSCNSTSQSKKTSISGSSFTFTATSVTAVYLTISASNVEYEIIVNGRSTVYQGTSFIDNCKFTWSSGSITTSTTIVTVNVHGPATPAMNGRRQAPNNWSFEFHNFLTTVRGSGGGGGGGGGGAAPTTGLPGSAGGSASSGIALNAHGSVLLVLGAVAIGFLGFS